MKLKDLKVDQNAQVKGVEVEIFPDAFVTVRSAKSDEYTDMRARLLRKYAKLYINSDQLIPAKIMNKINALLLADYIVVGWRGAGITDDDGNPLQYSRDTALRLFENPEHRRFKDMCFEAAGTDEAFSVGAKDAAAGN